MSNADPQTGCASGTASQPHSSCPYACTPATSQGRRYQQDASPSRTAFQRDRDRIIHSTAFRRLTHKTQVFIYHEGDHYRTRLTHSLEVAQIARSIARTLRLDEDLAEAIALAHDLGHTPFGHAGEHALNAAMSDYGGFDHNAQSLRIVTELERKYAAYDGLNLTWETLEGLAKHNGPLTDAAGQPIGACAETGLPHAIEAYRRIQDLRLQTQPSAEAQVAALSDDIAYNNHDIDDGVRAGILPIDQLKRVPLCADILREVETRFSELERPRLIYEFNRRLITLMVDDALAETRRRLAALGPSSPDDIRAASAPVVAFSEAMDQACDELRFFLLNWVYRHRRISEIMTDAQSIVTDLFARYMSDPTALPEKWLAGAHPDDEVGLARQVCDFIAGMTDRFAIKEHRRLFDRTPDLR
ncbi:MAG: deoxyguanosinetriphosphate triphosphohydrolase [Methyloligellaceae bacterium]